MATMEEAHNVKVVGTSKKTIVLGTDQSVWKHLISHLFNNYRFILYDNMGVATTNPNYFDFEHYSNLQGYARARLVPQARPECRRAQQLLDLVKPIVELDSEKPGVESLQPTYTRGVAIKVIVQIPRVRSRWSQTGVSPRSVGPVGTPGPTQVLEGTTISIRARWWIHLELVEPMVELDWKKPRVESLQLTYTRGAAIKMVVQVPRVSSKVDLCIDLGGAGPVLVQGGAKMDWFDSRWRTQHGSVGPVGAPGPTRVSAGTTIFSDYTPGFSESNYQYCFISPVGAPGPTRVPASTTIGIRGRWWIHGHVKQYWARPEWRRAQLLVSEPMVDPRTCEAVPVARLGEVGRTQLSLRFLDGDLHGQFKGGFMVDYGIGLGGAKLMLVQGGAKVDWFDPRSAGPVGATGPTRVPVGTTLNTKDYYYGGFELEDIKKLLKAMESNYKAWCLGFASLMVGGDIDSVVVQEFNLTLFNTRPDIALSIFRTIFESNLSDLLPYVTVPCYIIRSSKDLAVPVSIAEYLHRNLGEKSIV
ncbi:hypothetical protein LguiB_016581 [Lonicera macranthoides]